MPGVVAGIAGVGFGIAHYIQAKEAAKFQRAYNQTLYAANLKGLRSGYRLTAQQTHAEQYRRTLETTLNLRENARRGLTALGLSTTAQARRGVGGQTARLVNRDIVRQEQENRNALERRADLDNAAASRSLEIAALNTNAQILQATPAPIQDPNILNSIMFGLNAAGSVGGLGG